MEKDKKERVDTILEVLNCHIDNNISVGLEIKNIIGLEMKDDDELVYKLDDVLNGVYNSNIRLRSALKTIKGIVK